MATNRLGHHDNVPAARDLRTRQTSAELTLWDALRTRRLAGLKFRRQQPVGPFVLDFCCPDRRLGIELDGAVHASLKEHDQAREALLTRAGYRVLRFPNEAVRDDLPAVLESIRAAAMAQPSLPAQRPPRTGAL